MAYEKVTRQLRLRYHITYGEFAAALGVCKNWIVELESPHKRPTPHQLDVLQQGYQNVIARRRSELLKLEQDYLRARTQLLCVRALDEIPEERA